MPKRVGFDGTLIYDYLDAIAAATWGGRDLLPYHPIEILVQPDGWGRVTVLVPIDTAIQNTIPPRVDGQARPMQYGFNNTGNQIDGTTRTYTYWGNVVVTS